MNSKDYLNNGIIQLWLEDNICYATYIVDTLDYIKSKKVIEDRVGMFGHLGDIPLMLDVTSLKRIDPEAKKYLADAGTKNVSCCAMIVNSKLNAMTINVFLMFVNLIRTPVKTFTEKEKAISWLKKEHKRLEVKRLKQSIQ